ncbi:aromatic hydrocarbon degradation protein [Apibacter raozihei]|uniref:aromatic hydrocarbon degradation protein n=1 Tax=Apibacter TaxID=1778601 RepID=UPI000FE2E330|nr:MULTISPECIES: aromatic hydrocarbon degradation protein [Apibacter]
MKIKIIRILSILAFTNCIYAQQTSTSAYSSIGLGESKINSDLTLSSMGGIGTSYISDFANEANFANPAANMNLRFTSFNLGVNTDYNKAKTSTESSGRSTTYLANVSIAFPIGDKSRAGLSLQPYTNMGYDMNINTQTTLNQKSVLSGRGGLNSFSGFYSYNITDELALGAKIGYVWGELKKEQENSVEGSTLISGISNKKQYGFFDYTLGAAYLKKLPSDHLLKIGATFTLGHDVSTSVHYLYSSYYYNTDGAKTSVDTIRYTRGDHDTKLPSSFSLGVAYGKEQKWSLAADFKYTNQSKLSIPEDIKNNLEYKNKYRVSLGGWILPNVNGFRSYFERVIYRYGVYYENTGIELYNNTINQYGVTAGVGVPLGKAGRQDPSLLNLGIEVGQRGTTSNGLIKENFFNFKVGFNFDDLWFRKRQYD